MSRRTTILVLTTLVFVTWQLLSHSAWAGSITDEVKKSVDEVVKIVSDPHLRSEPTQRRHALKQAISTIFDYTEMAKRSLGKHWNELSQTEKKHFSALFETLLENSYADKIESYHNEQIIFISERIDGEYAEVRSNIITPKKDEYAINYRLLNENGIWMVYDIVIEGVSLVSNYRSQFDRIISEQGYRELLRKLESKSREITGSAPVTQ